MSEINWDLAPEGTAYADVTFFDKSHCEVGNQLDIKCPQTKTVADAYEWANGEWKEDNKTIWWSKSVRDFTWGSDVTNDTVCTREQFETYAKEQEGKQEGEKWTHTTSLGKCRVLIDKPDDYGYVVIEGEEGSYSLVPPLNLKPIKPKLTKSDAWDRCVEEFGVRNIKYVMQELMEEFEII